MIISYIRKIDRIIDSKVKYYLRIKFKKKHIKKIIDKKDYFNMPIYIISFNRLEYLKQMINWLNKYGYKNIIIIDNHSDYKPLLDYYKECNCKVIRMNKNYGYKVFNENIRFLFDRYKGYYVLTDPDLKPINECPSNFIEVFLKTLYENIDYSKVGFSLKIDDIPDSYYLKEEVVKWESQYYKQELNSKQKAYIAKIDTTFSLNSPMSVTAKSDRLKGIRIGYPYQLMHLPWYENNKEDNIHYLNTKRNDQTTWNGEKSKEELNNWINNHLKTPK